MEKQPFVDAIRENLIFVIICCLSALLINLFGIWPYFYKIREKMKEINTLQYQIKKQTELKPMFRDILNKSSEYNSSIIKAIEKTPLQNTDSNIKDTREILGLIKRIAQNSGLRVLSVTPELQSISKDTKYLSYVVNIQGGNLNYLRIFLIQIGKVSFLEHIEKISIEPNDIQRMYDFSLRLFISYK